MFSFGVMPNFGSNARPLNNGLEKNALHIWIQNDLSFSKLFEIWKSDKKWQLNNPSISPMKGNLFPNQTWDYYTSNACQNSSISLKKNKHGWWTRKLLANPHVCQTFISILLLRLLLYFTSFVFLFQHRRLCWQHQQNWPIIFQGNKSRDPAHRKFTGALPYPFNCRCCDLFSFEVKHSPSSNYKHFTTLLTQVK